jgi:arginine deiminase
VPWVRRARAEHDAFAAALAERGVEVLYVQDLLAEVLEQPPVHRVVLERMLEACGITSDPDVAELECLAHFAPSETAAALIGGLTWAELPFELEVLAARVACPDAFAVPPLPGTSLPATPPRGSTAASRSPSRPPGARR